MHPTQTAVERGPSRYAARQVATTPGAFRVTFAVAPESISISTIDAVASEALAGLSAIPKTLSPWLFYDEAGSHLFEKITELPEYYLTRTERSIFAAHAEEILREAASSHGASCGEADSDRTRRGNSDQDGGPARGRGVSREALYISPSMSRRPRLPRPVRTS